MVRRHQDGSYDDEQLKREGGVFVGIGSGREVGPDEGDRPPVLLRSEARYQTFLHKTAERNSSQSGAGFRPSHEITP